MQTLLSTNAPAGLFRDVSLVEDHAERVRLEHLALAPFPEELRVWQDTNAMKLYRWLSECDRRQFPKSTPTEKQFAYLELATTSFVRLAAYEIRNV
ncbi:hypothetical protein AURDEDRAFT_165623 [Auricularia subglabra TFB-10046 SS5]|nr:hypothetical protein AURDEDRAFT_165623 [Auricularia subglabra TFB-10046 SS5]